MNEAKELYYIIIFLRLELYCQGMFF